MTDIPKLKPFERSANTAMIYQRIGQMQIGDLLTYKELSDILGEPVDGSNSHLQSARDMAVRYDGIVLENVRTVGYKRLSDTGIVHDTDRDMKSIGRKAKKATRKLESADYAALPLNEKHKFNVRSSILGVLRAASSRRREKRIMNKTEPDQKLLQSETTGFLFGKK